MKIQKENGSKYQSGKLNKQEALCLDPISDSQNTLTWHYTAYHHFLS